MGEWGPVRIDSTLRGKPFERVSAPALTRLELLPFDQLTWEAFESIQLRVMLDVLGLRDPRQYGEPGQKQQGIDLIAAGADLGGTALQSKNYAKKLFTAASLRSAVNAFRTTERPFTVNRFIIGVSRPVRSTGVMDELIRLQAEFLPHVLELWDARRLSDLVRPHPDIVTQYFTEETARNFCGEFVVHRPVLPSEEARTFSDAITLEPEKLTGARALLDAADAESDSAAALALIEQAQAKLRQAGFGAHASRHEPARAQLLAALGRGTEAARQILDEMWTALDHGRTGNAQATFDRLRKLAEHLADPSAIDGLSKVGTAAFGLYFNPLGQLPEPPALLVGDAVDHAQLLILAGETARALDNHEWLFDAVPVMSRVLEESSLQDGQRVRLRILVAETTQEWSPLLDDARRRRITSDLTPLIAARHARYHALRENVNDAVAGWEEAAALASLARQWDAAGTWVLSKRSYLTHWRLTASGELIALETALDEQPYPAAPVVPRAEKALEEAHAGLRANNHLRSAAIAAQRAVRDAVVTADWSGERKARIALAAVMQASDEPSRAAHHLAHAAATKEIEALGKAYPNRFIDVVGDLDGANHWMVGSAYRLIATQADVVPDDRVDEVVSHILRDLSAAEKGKLRDVTFYASSRYNNAFKALAGLAPRVSLADADAALAFFERQPKVEANHYRYHDEDEAVAVAGITLAHPELTHRGIAHLVPLMARAQGAQRGLPLRVLDAYPDLARAALLAVEGEGETWAAEMLAHSSPSDIHPGRAAEALERLSRPLEHTAGVYSVGTNAIGDSLLLSAQPQAVLIRVIRELMRRANDPRVSSFDRGDFLSAATNLALNLTESSKSGLFASAARLSRRSTPSEQDELDRQFSHPLSVVRTDTTGSDLRGRAVLLASVLATDPGQRGEVRTLVYSLLGGDSDFFAARALGNLAEDITEDLAFLSGQGWAMRCLAATMWARYGGAAHIGDRLAGDEEVRVREAFARELAVKDAQPSERAVRRKLATDPSYRVRRALIEQPPQ